MSAQHLHVRGSTSAHLWGPVELHTGASAPVGPNWPLPSAPGSSMRHDNAYSRRTLTQMPHSLLDCFWPSRPPCAASRRREQEGHTLRPRRPRCLPDHLCYHAHVRQARTTHHDARMAGGFQRVPQGSSIPKSSWQTPSILTWVIKNVGAKIRPFHRHRLARLQGPGTGPVAAREGLRRSGNGWDTFSPWSLQEAEKNIAGTGTILSLPHGLIPVYEMMSRERGSIDVAAWLDVVISYVDVNMCTRIPRSLNKCGLCKHTTRVDPVSTLSHLRSRSTSHARYAR